MVYSLQTYPKKIKLLKSIGSFSLGILTVCLPQLVSVGAMSETSTSMPHPWSITGSLGYTNYQNMYRGDGQTALGRLAFARNVYTYSSLNWGIEAGVQNGNTMRFFPSPEAIEALGGLPIQTTIKPMLDLLLTLKTATLSTVPIFAAIKGGMVYRRWQMNESDSISDKSQLAGEVQAGLGWGINERASINIFYQGIFGANPDFHVNAINRTGYIANIPAQHGVLFGLTIIA